MAFTFSRLCPHDLPLLQEWLGRPHVAERWDGPVSLESMAKKFELHVSSSHIFGYLAKLDDLPIGYCQAYQADRVGDGWWPDAAPGTWGIDQFLADGTRLGMGFGTRMVQAFAAQVFARHDARRILTDPSPDNLRAIRCYEKAGFRVLGEVETPDGKAVLMQMDRP